MFLLVPAVPQARKASLARFLEKRKERYKSCHRVSCGFTLQLKSVTMVLCIFLTCALFIM